MNKIENKINTLELTEQINFFREKYDDKKELAHYDLLKIIRDEFDEEIGAGKISVTSYKDSQNKDRPMYILTLSQAKQVLVRESKAVRKATIKYIEQLEQRTLTTNEDDLLKKKKIEIMDKNARIRTSNQFLKIAKLTNDEDYKNVLIANSVNSLVGSKLLELPKAERKTYSATEIANMLNTSANKIGKIANAHNLKTEEYGKLYHDKAKYTDKHVETFRYYDNAIDVFRQYL